MACSNTTANSKSRFSTTHHRVLIPRLPNEVAMSAISFMSPGTLNAFSRVSRAHWEPASAKLWQSLPSGTILLSLLSKSNAMRMTPGDEHRLWNDTEVWGENILGVEEEDMDKIDQNPSAEYPIVFAPFAAKRFQAFQEYAGFVKELALNDPILTPGHRKFLLHKVAIEKITLLPNLQSLLVSEDKETSGEYGWGSNAQCTLTSEHLVMLFLSPSIKMLAICGRCINDMNWTTIAERAQGVVDLRFGSNMRFRPDPEITQKRHAHLLFEDGTPNLCEVDIGFADYDDPTIQEHPLLAWGAISSFTISGVYVSSFLRPLPFLTKLTIVDLDTYSEYLGPNAADWLPMLRDLGLRRVNAPAAQKFFEGNLNLREVTSLHWEADPHGRNRLWREDASPYEYRNAARALVRNMPSLGTLSVKFLDFSDCQDVLSELGALSESFIKLRVSLFYEEILGERHGFRAINLTGQHLQELSIDDIALTPVDLCSIATNFLTLRRLRARLTGSAAPNSYKVKRSLQHQGYATQQIELQLRIDRGDWSVRIHSGEQEVIQEFSRFLLRLWQNLTLFRPSSAGLPADVSRWNDEVFTILHLSLAQQRPLQNLSARE